MDDDSLRGVLARCFAALATGGDDLDEHIAAARKVEQWIMTGDYDPADFARFEAVAARYCDQARRDLKARKRGGK